MRRSLVLRINAEARLTAPARERSHALRIPIIPWLPRLVHTALTHSADARGRCAHVVQTEATSVGLWLAPAGFAAVSETPAARAEQWAQGW